MGQKQWDVNILGVKLHVVTALGERICVFYQFNLIAKVVQFEKSWPALHLCLNESGRSHFYIASTEVMVTKAGENKKIGKCRENTHHLPLRNDRTGSEYFWQLYIAQKKHYIIYPCYK